MAAFSLQNRIVVLTGGARGIGLACAEALVAKGAKVALCDIDSHEGFARAASLGERCHFYKLDVTDRADFCDTIDRVEADLGPVDVLINNAGIMPVGKMLDLDAQTEQRQVDVNLMGPLHGMHAVLPGMLARNSGHIVNVASLAGRIPAPFAALYSGTKFAVVGMTESLRHEFADTGLHFCLVYPAVVQTGLIAGISAPGFPAPLRPEQVATSVVHGLERRKARVYAPRLGSVLGLLPWLLPDAVAAFLGRISGADTMFLEVDEEARRDYRQRSLGNQ